MTVDLTVLNVRHSAVPCPIPAGACDCHVHIFGPFDRYPLAPDRVFMPSLASVQDLRVMHAALGIERAVVVQASPQGYDNRCLTDALRALNAAGHAARGVAVLGDDIGARDLRALHDAGVRGARINLQSYGQHDPVVARRALRGVADRIAGMDWHVQIYSNLAVIASMADDLAACPVPVVVDHFALASAPAGVDQPGFDVLLDVVGAGNVYVKLSAPYRLTTWADGSEPARALPIARAMVDTRLDRMLWGTDWPHTGAWPGQPRLVDTMEPFHPIDDGVQLQAFCAWVNDDERRTILVDNPARLYGFQD